MTARRRSVAAVVLALAVLLVPVSQAGSSGGHRDVGVGATAGDVGGIGHGGTAALAASLPLDLTAEPQASCSLSSSEIEPGQEVTLDAGGSENAILYRYSKFGDAFTDWTESTSITFVYEEEGTYTPAVQVMNENETTDTASCGELVVSDSTPTPTPTPTPTDTPSPTPSPTPTGTPTPSPTSTPTDTPTSTPSPEPVARCTVSDTSVEVGEEVTLDASGSENADGYQFDRLGTGDFGELYAEPTRTVTYEEPGTYVPQVKAWSTETETSDTATCGEVSVTSATGTPTDSPTPSPTPEPTSRPSATPSPSPTPTPTPSPSPTGTATPSGTPTGTVTPSATPTPTRAPATVTAEWWYSPSTPRAGQPVSLVADGPPGAVTYRWDLDDDGQFERTGRLASVAFGQRGRHTVTLKAVGPNGTSRTSSRTIRALPATTGTPSGNASFWFAPNTPEPTEAITFLADPGRLRGSFDGFGWDLDDDGSIEQRGRLASRSYPEGRHLVDLVFVRKGASNLTVSRTVVVGDPGPGVVVPSPNVTTPASATPSPAPTSSPGFGLAVALVAVLLGAVALRRRGAP